jgi:hypothetical protein
MHRDGQDLLRPFLFDDILIEDVFYLVRLEDMIAAILIAFLGVLLGYDLVAQLNTLIADIDRRSRDEFLDFILALAAKGA